jgi:hypothetical protein
LTFFVLIINLFPPFSLIKKVEPKNQGCRKPAKNARIPAKEKQVTAGESTEALAVVKPRLMVMID